MPTTHDHTDTRPCCVIVGLCPPCCVQAAASKIVLSGALESVHEDAVRELLEAFGEALQPALLQHHSAWMGDR